MEKKKKVQAPLIIFLVAALILGIISKQEYLITLFVFCCIYTIAVSGFDVLFGFSGQISMGHAAYFAAGAYTSAILSTRVAGFPVWLAMLIGAIAASLLSVMLVIFSRITLPEIYVAQNADSSLRAKLWFMLVLRTKLSMEK